MLPRVGMDLVQSPSCRIHPVPGLEGRDETLLHCAFHDLYGGVFLTLEIFNRVFCHCEPVLYVQIDLIT